MTDPESAADELLPCPFCGNLPGLFPYHHGYGIIILCMTDGCVGPHVALYGDGNALKRWNTRTLSPAHLKIAADEWVSVKDKLPMDSQRVIAIYRGVYHHRIVTFWRDAARNPHFGHPNEPDGKGSQPATHWHPLPELPETLSPARPTNPVTLASNQSLDGAERRGVRRGISTMNPVPKPYLVPMTLRKANDFVAAHHRHNGRTARNGGKWACGLAFAGDLVVRSLAGLHLKDTFKGLWVSDEAIKFHAALPALTGTPPLPELQLQ